VQIELPDKPLHAAADQSPEARHTDWGYDARFSPDGKRIISASFDGTVRVWDAETGTPVRRIVAAMEKPIVGAPKPALRTLSVRSVNHRSNQIRA